MTTPNIFVVLVPGYMGSKLRDRRTGELVWLDLPGLLREPFRIVDKLRGLFAAMQYPNDNLEPAGIVEDVIFAPPLLKQEQYSRLSLALQRFGCSKPNHPEPGKIPYYTFAYDWRQDNRISARQLGAWINGWKGSHPGAKAWIIGHSNGGIVARWYIEKEGGHQNVERLFLMGSPWDGAPKALQVLMDGMDIFLTRVFNSLVNIPSLTRQTVLSFPSFYQIVPHHFQFLQDEIGQPVDPFKDLGWLENDRQRQMALDGREFNKELGLNLSVDTLCFFGVKQLTTSLGVVEKHPDGRWKRVAWQASEQGDGTVPQRSAVHPNAAQKLPYVANHGDIYIVPPVLEKLGFEISPPVLPGVLEAVTTISGITITFEPDHEAVDPGALVGIWATIHDENNGAPISQAVIDVQVELAQALPGPGMLASEQAGDIHFNLSMLEDPAQPGYYRAEFDAPLLPGYYRLLASIAAGESPLIQLEELLLVDTSQIGPPPAAGIHGQFEGIEGSTSSAHLPTHDESAKDQEWREVAESSPPPDNEPPVFRSWEGAPPPEDEALVMRSWVGTPPPAPPIPPSPAPTAELAGSSFPLSEVGESELPSASQPPDETTQPGETRFVNAEVYHPFSDPIQDVPLTLGQEATLAIFIDTRAGSFMPPVSFDESSVFDNQQSLVQLDVYLTSHDFLIHSPSPQILRVPLHGHSRNKARFDIEPLRTEPGVGEATVLIFKNKNFIQGLTFKLNIGAGARAIAEVETLGRPPDSSFGLQSRDLTLFIKKAIDGYDVSLVGETFTEARLPISLLELNQMVKEARQALQDVVWLATGDQGIFVQNRLAPLAAGASLPYQWGLLIPEDVAQEALKRLGRAGWKIYQSLFFGPRAGADSKLLGTRLRQLAETGQLKLQIISQDFLLPWGLLYLAEEVSVASLDPQRFLGARHIVEHIPLQTDMPVFDQHIPSQPNLNVSLNVDPGIDRPQFPLVSNQLAWWEQLQAETGLNLVRRTAGEEFIQALADETNTEQIIYFYGHAASLHLDQPGGPGASSLGFAGGKKVTLDDLFFEAPTNRKLSSHPLVFINACESAELSPLFYGGFMPYFTAKGARGMIGAECEVPAVFAAEWARRFFERFLGQEKSLGQIFLELRSEFLSQHNNLLGLLYALYCDGDTRVTPKLR